MATDMTSDVQLDQVSNTPSADLPHTPPPSLVSTTLSSPPSLDASTSAHFGPTTKPSSLLYTRDYLLTLLRGDASPPRPPAPRRLSTFHPILRGGSVSHWGEDETRSSILLCAELDGEPISKTLPVPHNENDAPDVPRSVTSQGDKSDTVSIRSVASGISITSTATGATVGSGSTIMFDYTSPPDRDPPRPVMIAFANADPFAKTSTYKPTPFPAGTATATGNGFANSAPSRPGLGNRKASAVFQQFPASVNSSKTSLALSLSSGRDWATLRGGVGAGGTGSTGSGVLRSRSSSVSSEGSSISSLSSKGMNPFAPPFLKPSFTPTSSTSLPSNPISISTTNSYSNSSPSLPEPKPTGSIKLPKSLPARPNAPLPPVFVKRESAALPQPMSLPEVAPMGTKWEGESGLSGNDKRRRASAMGLGYRPLTIDETNIKISVTTNTTTTTTTTASTSPASSSTSPGDRPQHLVQLGQKLRSSVSVHTSNNVKEVVV